MKKVNLRNALSALVITLSFVFLGVQVNAQSLSGSGQGPYSLPTGDYVTPTEAQVTLLNEMNVLKNNMDGLSSGPALTAQERLFFYYYGIHASLESGQTIVAKAIIEGFQALADSNGNGNLTNAELSNLKQVATNLLEQ